MTIHAAKGLQFPVVFLPALDEENAQEAALSWLMRTESIFLWHIEDDSLRRKEIHHFRMRKEKELEEEKRLFYVAVTRAQDFLCMLAAPKKGKNHTGRLKYVTDNLDYLPSIKIVKESDIDTLYYHHIL